jgi:hypothetical protein
VKVTVTFNFPDEFLGALEDHFRKHFAKQGPIDKQTVKDWAQGAVWERYEAVMAHRRTASSVTFEEIAKILGDTLSSEGILHWLSAKNRVLGGRTPFEVLRDGGYEAVKEAARAYDEGSYV